GNYATVESRDTGTATTEMQNMSSKGELQSVSEGQQYLKRFGSTWKITGDRIDFEKVKVAFGLAQHLNSTFTAPEQVKAGKQFSARLEVTLPPGFFAMGSITNQALKFPQPAPAEKPRSLDQPSVLERVMPANTENHNELLTATVILVNPARSVMGVCFLTRRLNVVPETHDISDVQTAKIDTPEKLASGKAAEKTTEKTSEKEVDANKSDSPKSSDKKSDDTTK
ncbi:MAG: hypothetical protein KGS72_29055, partial [Cyanobacteria bacterium REEB67]|nr:hypothetical protein [Cyanobacteria bacterium REEB67]